METPVETNEKPVTPAKPRKKRRRHTAPRAAKPVNAPAEFAGLTEIECCASCNADRCIISGINVCGHPFKGGQIAPNDSAALARSIRAKKVLAHRRIDLTKDVV
jgi:hypothetical protein